MMFSIGADPEVFVGDSNGVRSIIGMVGGTKEHPLPLPLGEGFFIQEDNVALEYNIPISNSREKFIDNIATAMDFIGSTLQDSFGLQFVKDSAISFPVEQLQDPRAFVFGCEPDFNGWTGKVNRKPKADDPNLRSCGGHVHIGITGTKYEGCDKHLIVQACDVFMGIPSVLMDKGVLRKRLYGKAGACRWKPYGVEYRTLSNFWVFDKKLVEWVYNNTERALDAVLNNMSFDDDAKLIQSTINNNVIPMAEMLVEKYGLSVV
jgi:hypothetical protein